MLSNIVSGKVLKKYRVMSISGIRLGVSAWRLRRNFKTGRAVNSRKGAIIVSEEVKQNVIQLFIKYINSKLIPVKKDTITKTKRGCRKDYCATLSSICTKESEMLSKTEDVISVIKTVH